MGYRCPKCKKDFNCDKNALWEHINDNEDCRETVQTQLFSIIRVPKDLDAEDAIGETESKE